MPVKNAARLQPIASRAPNPAMMPRPRACTMRIRLRGKRSLTLLAHNTAARQPPNMPMIILPSMRAKRRPVEMDQLIIAPTVRCGPQQLQQLATPAGTAGHRPEGAGDAKIVG